MLPDGVELSKLPDGYWQVTVVGSAPGGGDLVYVCSSAADAIEWGMARWPGRLVGVVLQNEGEWDQLSMF